SLVFKLSMAICNARITSRSFRTLSFSIISPVVGEQPEARASNISIVLLLSIRFFQLAANGASMLPLRGFSAKINKKSLPIVLLRVIFREENPKQWSIDSVVGSFLKR
ncbi:MAG: hypothetical protein KDC47_11515, partial [Flavobacteriaceae bacterium]|nr:hypothetical protein [Flavobacteriaceae bacterium]